MTSVDQVKGSESPESSAEGCEWWSIVCSHIIIHVHEIGVMCSTVTVSSDKLAYQSNIHVHVHCTWPQP